MPTCLWRGAKKNIRQEAQSGWPKRQAARGTNQRTHFLIQPDRRIALSLHRRVFMFLSAVSPQHRVSASLSLSGKKS
jgi:hypothetical protein